MKHSDDRMVTSFKELFPRFRQDPFASCDNFSSVFFSILCRNHYPETRAWGKVQQFFQLGYFADTHRTSGSVLSNRNTMQVAHVIKNFLIIILRKLERSR